MSKCHITFVSQLTYFVHFSFYRKRDMSVPVLWDQLATTSPTRLAIEKILNEEEIYGQNIERVLTYLAIWIKTSSLCAHAKYHLIQTLRELDCRKKLLEFIETILISAGIDVI